MDERAAAAAEAAAILSDTGMPTAAAAVAYEYIAAELANAAAGENAWFNDDDDEFVIVDDDWIGDWDVEWPLAELLLWLFDNEFGFTVVVLAAVSSNNFNCFWRLFGLDGGVKSPSMTK